MKGSETVETSDGNFFRERYKMYQASLKEHVSSPPFNPSSSSSTAFLCL